LSPSKAGAHRVQLLRVPVAGSRSSTPPQPQNQKHLTISLLSARSKTFTEVSILIPLQL
jgi:hypothetical protein